MPPTEMFPQLITTHLVLCTIFWIYEYDILTTTTCTAADPTSRLPIEPDNSLI